MEKADEGKSDINYQIDASGLSDGIYNLVIIYSSAIESKRIIILK